MKDELARRASNKDRVLERLRRGPAENHELVAIAGWRYGGRIHELRRQGYVIVREDLAGTACRFTLISEPKPKTDERPLHEATQTGLFGDVA